MRNRFLVLVGLVLAILLGADRRTPAQAGSVPGRAAVITTFGATTVARELDFNGTTSSTATATWTDNTTVSAENMYALVNGVVPTVIDESNNNSTTSTPAGLYAYNATGIGNDNDHSLGMLTDPSTNIYVGLLAQNQAGAATGLDVSYVCETWRGNGSRTPQVKVYYAVGDATLTLASAVGNGTAIAALDCTPTVIDGSNPGGSGQTLSTTVDLSGSPVGYGQYVLVYWNNPPPARGQGTGVAVDALRIGLEGAQIATTTTVTALPLSRQTYGTTTTFTATVTGSTNPTDGSLAFTVDGNAPSGTVAHTPNTNVWTLTTVLDATAAGAGHAVAATYTAGSAAFSGSNGSTIYGVDSQTPGMALTPASGSVIYGASVTYNTAITQNPSGGVDPLTTGTLAYSMDSSCTTKTCITTKTPVGSTPKVTYTPAALPAVPDYTTKSATSALTVTKAASLTTVTSDNPTATYNQDVTFTATITNQSNGGGDFATGQVQFSYTDPASGKVVKVGNAVDLKSGSASIGPLKAGVDFPLGTNVTVGASYSGDANYSGSVGTTSQSTTESVTVTITNALTSTYSTSVNFTATVLGASGDVVTDGQVDFALSGTATLDAGLGNVLADGTVSVPSPTTTFVAGPYTLTATYVPAKGSFHTAPKTAPTASYTRNQAATSIAVSLTNNPAQFDDPAGATMTATLTVTGATAAAPSCTGCVTFFDNGVSIGTANMTAGVASLNKTDFSIGNHPITAQYTGNGNFAASPVSPIVVQQIDKVVSKVTVSVTTLPAGLVYGSVDKFSVNVSAQQTGNFSSAPTGAIIASAGGMTAPSQLLDLAGNATFDTTVFSQLLNAGPVTLSVAYAGDGIHTPGNGSATFTLAKASTSVIVSSSQNPSVVGQSVTFSASITGQFAGGPTGSLNFSDNGSALGSVVVGNGSGSVIASNLTSGQHTIAAQYAGDANFLASTGAPIVQAVSSASTTTQVLPSSNPVLPGTPVTFGVNVAAVAPATGNPSGSVTVTSDGATLGIVTLAGGAGTIQSPTGFTVGTHLIVATYGGDTSFNGSTSDPTTLSVTATATTFVVTATPDSPFSGQSVTVSAKLSSAAGIPTGSVTLKDGGAVVGTSPLSGGQASFTVLNLTPGTHAFTVSYPGDGARLAGSGSTAVVVRNRPTSTTLAQDSAQTAPGDAVTFSASVTSDAGPVPNGVVTFLADGVALGNPAQAIGGSASASTSSLGLGSHDIVAIYEGSSGYETSQSFHLTHVVATKPDQDGGVTTTPTPDAGAGAHPGSGTPGSSGGGGTPGAGGAPGDGDAGFGLGSITPGSASGSDSSCSSTGQPLSLGGFLLAGIVALFVSRRRRTTKA